VCSSERKSEDLLCFFFQKSSKLFLLASLFPPCSGVTFAKNVLQNEDSRNFSRVLKSSGNKALFPLVCEGFFGKASRPRSLLFFKIAAHPLGLLSRLRTALSKNLSFSSRPSRSNRLSSSAHLTRRSKLHLTSCLHLL
jgi:hypothetical protein